MTQPAIRVVDMSKQYHIGLRQQGYKTLRETIVESMTAPIRRTAKLLRGQATGAAELDATHWALQGISFEIQHGEVVGVIGRNGAGKSTLLKILSQIAEPTHGFAEIRGRVGSLLEVGTGFHPELTGRENIYLNGAILGMRKREISLKFDEIVAFSEIDKFLDTPVKHYSSGMYVRLAFAVAAHLEPEILLVDEVLAVGDASFQKKCLGKMQDVAREGRTVLFVSHNMSAVSRHCPETILLEEGKLVLRAKSQVAIERYLSHATNNQAEKTWRPEDLPASCGPFRPIKFRVCKADGTTTNLVSSSHSFSIEFEYELATAVRDFRIGFCVYSYLGEVLFVSFDRDKLSDYERHSFRPPGRYVSRCHIPANLLNVGSFGIGFRASVPKLPDFYQELPSIELKVNGINAVGAQWPEPRSGLVRPALEWDIECLQKYE